MADNRHMDLELKPLRPVLVVTSSGVIEVSIQSLGVDTIGEKAFGLACLPSAWTLPFVVVSHELLVQYRSTKTEPEVLLRTWEKRVVDALSRAGVDLGSRIIVRSSGCTEGLTERGQLYSMVGTASGITLAILNCLQKLDSDQDVCDKKIHLVIQKYAEPISARGQFSNERRCFEEKRDWEGEFDPLPVGKGKSFYIHLRNWRQKIAFQDHIGMPLSCGLSAHVSEVLKIPAAWVLQQNLRIHFEWTWDGKTVYLVQADQERYTQGEDPTQVAQTKFPPKVALPPECLSVVGEQHAQRYNKIRNVLTYLKLGLPITTLYILDDQSVISALARGESPAVLDADLRQLIQGSVVIRMDIATDNAESRQLLPRQEVRNVADALVWLKNQSAKHRGEHSEQHVAFIFHRFIPAVSSAFAYAVPQERNVLIEALWGLPEGLYYNSHDVYMVDTGTPNLDKLGEKDADAFQVWEKLYYKHFFVAPDNTGRWMTRTLRPPYDWTGSIRERKLVKRIALLSRRIAEHDGKPVSIMWFIGVHRGVSPSRLLPWYHEPFNPVVGNRAITHRKKTPFDKSFVIRTAADIEVLKHEITAPQSHIRRIRIEPHEESLLRNKNTLREIGELSKKINAVILLEGAILSHAYYQLMMTGAVVEVVRSFEGFDERQEFNKLVRDKVPACIEGVGEIVRTAHLKGELLLKSLREKLVEEAFEALDATDQGSIVEELADLSEVIDGILCQLSVSKDELMRCQKRKHEARGGFTDGVILLETRNPPPTERGTRDTADDLLSGLAVADVRGEDTSRAREALDRGHAVVKRSDRKKGSTETELILHVEVPVFVDDWTTSTPDTPVHFASERGLRGTMVGKRSGSIRKIDLSIFIPSDQPDLFIKKPSS